MQAVQRMPADSMGKAESYFPFVLQHTAAAEKQWQRLAADRKKARKTEQIFVRLRSCHADITQSGHANGISGGARRSVPGQGILLFKAGPDLLIGTGRSKLPRQYDERSDTCLFRNYFL